MHYAVLYGFAHAHRCCDKVVVIHAADGTRGAETVHHCRQLDSPSTEHVPVRPTSRPRGHDEINSKQWSLLAQLTLMAAGAINHERRHCCHLPAAGPAFTRCWDNATRQSGQPLNTMSLIVATGSTTGSPSPLYCYSSLVSTTLYRGVCI